MPVPQLTVEGQVVGEPEFRFTPEGLPIAKFRMVATDRRRDQRSQEWVDGDKFWVTVTCFRKLAENVAESLRARDAVVVVGRLSTAEWTGEDGTVRRDNRFIATSVGPSLFFLPRPHGTPGAPQTAPDRRGQQRPVQDVSLPAAGPREPSPDDEPWTTPVSSWTGEDPWA